MTSVQDAPPRLLAVEKEGEYIAAQIQKSGRWIVISATLGLAMPLIPIVLFMDEAYWFEWLFAYNLTAAGAGLIGTLAGVAAPIWAAIRISFEVVALRRYRDYRADQVAFLAQDIRCPLNRRPNEQTTREV